jgi:bifunctional non-homologous end joining protein LigD
MTDIEVSSADRVVFPDDGITKGEVVAYYALVADHMFPFIEGRALTVERFPQGTQHRGFMQKNAPSHFSDELIDTHTVPKEEGGTTSYPVPLHPDAVPAFANWGVITFHAPPSTVADTWHPDWVIWDLDPPKNGLEQVRDAAGALKELLEVFSIETVLMTSGSSGYHLRARLDRSTDAGETAQIARGLGALGVAAHPDLMTLAFRKADRGKRVFVDWLRNAPYSTSVIPWSLRGRSGAPVATPIDWSELADIAPNGVRLSDVPDRLKKDPWGSVEVQSLQPLVEQVSSALDDAGIDLEPFDRFRS